jgi:hypothetical protein
LTQGDREALDMLWFAECGAFAGTAFGRFVALLERFVGAFMTVLAFLGGLSVGTFVTVVVLAVIVGT